LCAFAEGSFRRSAHHAATGLYAYAGQQPLSPKHTSRTADKGRDDRRLPGCGLGLFFGPAMLQNLLVSTASRIAA